LRIFPQEYANRLRMIPAFEETLMKFDEADEAKKDKDTLE
jgi:hypothetical protein